METVKRETYDEIVNLKEGQEFTTAEGITCKGDVKGNIVEQ